MITLTTLGRRQRRQWGPLTPGGNFLAALEAVNGRVIHVIERIALETPMGKLSMYTFASPDEIGDSVSMDSSGNIPISGRYSPGRQVS